MSMSWNRNKYIVLLFLGDIALFLASTHLSALIRIGLNTNILEVHTGATGLTLLFFFIFFYVFDLYQYKRTYYSIESIVRLFFAFVVTFIVSGFTFYALPHWKFGRGIFLLQFACFFFFALGWRIVFSMLLPAIIERDNILIIGAGDSGASLYNLLTKSPSSQWVVGFLDDDPEKQADEMVLGHTDQLLKIAREKGVKTAVLAVTHKRSPELIKNILDAKLHGINIVEMPTLVERFLDRVPVNHIHDNWLLFSEGFYMVSEGRIQKIKRLMDIAASGALLLINLPLLAFTALAIKVESAGPLFFTQERVGKDGQTFKIWKFRSMAEDAEKDGAVWAQKNDMRVTRVGKIIRKFRIDELPQIWNIFRGDMSLIGPRPERPEFVSELEKSIPYYSVRHAVRPGLSGWAQVNYPYGASVEDAKRKLEYDVYYIKNMSLMLDLRILLKTISVVLFGQGAR